MNRSKGEGWFSLVWACAYVGYVLLPDGSKETAFPVMLPVLGGVAAHSGQAGNGGGRIGGQMEKPQTETTGKGAHRQHLGTSTSLLILTQHTELVLPLPLARIPK